MSSTDTRPMLLAANEAREYAAPHEQDRRTHQRDRGRGMDVEVRIEDTPAVGARGGPAQPAQNLRSHKIGGAGPAYTLFSIVGRREHSAAQCVSAWRNPD